MPAVMDKQSYAQAARRARPSYQPEALSLIRKAVESKLKVNVVEYAYNSRFSIFFQD